MGQQSLEESPGSLVRGAGTGLSNEAWDHGESSPRGVGGYERAADITASKMWLIRNGLFGTAGATLRIVVHSKAGVRQDDHISIRTLLRLETDG